MSEQWYCPNCGPITGLSFANQSASATCIQCGRPATIDTPAHVVALQKRITEQREKVAAWIISLGMATGHGDTLDDLLSEAGAQITEQAERIKILELLCMVQLEQRSSDSVPADAVDKMVERVRAGTACKQQAIR